MVQQNSTIPRTNPADYDSLELKKGDSFIVALDISASMRNTDCPGDMSRYQYALEQCKQFAHEASKYDSKGVTILTFGATVHNAGHVTEDKIDGLLKTNNFEGATNTNQVIQAAYDQHVKEGAKQTCLMIFTDGEPSNPDAVLKTIADITNKMKSNEEFTMIFITVGQRSPDLQEFLNVLDDDVPGAKYDIVSVNKLEDVDFATAFTKALTE